MVPPAQAWVTDLERHDRFVAVRRRRVSPTGNGLDIYEFTLADADLDTPPVCYVRRRVSRLDERIGFFADEARTVPLMHLEARLHYDPWVPYELTDTSLEVIGAIRKAFVARGLRSRYLLYGADGNEVAGVEVQVPAAVVRRRAGRIAIVAAAGAIGIPVIGAAGAAAAISLAAVTAVRQLRERFDPIDVVSELRIVRDGRPLGEIRRIIGTMGPGTPVPVPWQSASCVYEIDMSADTSKTVDRRLVLALPVAVEALRGVLADPGLR